MKRFLVIWKKSVKYIEFLMVDLLVLFFLEVYRLYDIFLNDLRVIDLDNMVSIVILKIYDAIEFFYEIERNL